MAALRRPMVFPDLERHPDLSEALGVGASTSASSTRRSSGNATSSSPASRVGGRDGGPGSSESSLDPPTGPQEAAVDLEAIDWARTLVLLGAGSIARPRRPKRSRPAQVRGRHREGPSRCRAAPRRPRRGSSTIPSAGVRRMTSLEGSHLHPSPCRRQRGWQGPSSLWERTRPCGLGSALKKASAAW